MASIAKLSAARPAAAHPPGTTSQRVPITIHATARDTRPTPSELPPWRMPARVATTLASGA
jgi:hypothetical protein